MSTIITNNLTQEIISSFNNAGIGEADAFRKKAISTFENIGLPTSKNEEYRFTPISKYFENNFIWADKLTEANLTSIKQFLIPNLEANLLVLVNGSYSKEFSKIISPNNKIIVRTLQEAVQTEPEVVTRYFNTISGSENDPFATLNSAFWQEGLVINIPESTHVEEPILILHINDTSHSQVIAHTKLLLDVGKESKVTLIEKFETAGALGAFHTFNEMIVLNEKASLEYIKIQNDKGLTCQVVNSTIQQLDHSELNAITLTLNGQLIRNNFSVSIDGEHCESHFNGLYILKGKTIVDNHTVVDHKKPNSQSNELYKGIMDENSKGVFNGKIHVRPHAQKTNAFQSNRNILIGDNATINTKPQLEIWADDVKCSHGCTTGQLDEEALFYLQSRGISKQSAQAMLLYAFGADVIATMQNSVLKEYFDLLISERLQKDF